MLRAAVLGSPVAHSLSPVLHSAAYAALGLSEWSYGLREVTEAELGSVVAGLDETWRGLSLTMPLKEVAFEVATTVSDVARDAGAVNTLVRRGDGGWDAHNTDVTGIVRAVEHVGHGGSAVVLGSGATARSAALAVVELGVRDVVVAARNAQAAAEVVDLLARHDVRARHVPLGTWADARPALVVSALAPAASEVVAESAQCADLSGTTLLDVVYADWPTPLARAVTTAGGAVVSGLDMLVHQAAEQFRLFTGHEPPVEVMLAAAREQVGS
ncbi:shikimate dehydrogenase [Knoellia remsis]|uniref:shikimate dehydrogenase n=1 Tax=Knoellia remsis TaxID=407159 RepID=UPI003183322F